MADWRIQYKQVGTAMPPLSQSAPPAYSSQSTRNIGLNLNSAAPKRTTFSQSEPPGVVGGGSFSQSVPASGPRTTFSQSAPPAFSRSAPPGPRPTFSKSAPPGGGGGGGETYTTTANKDVDEELYLSSTPAHDSSRDGGSSNIYVHHITYGAPAYQQPQMQMPQMMGMPYPMYAPYYYQPPPSYGCSYYQQQQEPTVVVIKGGKVKEEEKKKEDEKKWNYQYIY